MLIADVVLSGPLFTEVPPRYSNIKKFPIMLRTIWMLLIVAIGVNSPWAVAQTNDVDQKGVPTTGVFNEGDVDAVNLQNGNLHISIPIASLKQRGGSTLSLNLVYDTQAWLRLWIPNECGQLHCDPAGDYVVEQNPNVASGWRVTSSLDYEIDFLETDVVCQTTQVEYDQYTNWVVIDPQGTTHPMALRQEVGTNCNGQTLSGPTLDGSGYTYDINTGVLRAKNGAVLSYHLMKDANGNEISTTTDSLGRLPYTETDGPTITYTTPMGLTTRGPAYTKYTTMDSAGQPETYEIDYQAVDESSDICANTTGGVSCTDWDDGPVLVDKQLLLPNGKAYTFTYANGTPGDLAQLTLPTGATINYTYGDYYQGRWGSSGPDPTYSGGRSVASRTVTVNGVSSQWIYTIGGPSSEVVDPLGNKQFQSYERINVGSGTLMRTSSNKYDVQDTFQDASGNTLKTVTRTYVGDADYVANAVINVRPVSETITLDNGMQSQTQTDYETFTYTCDTCDTSAGDYVGIATRMNPTEVRQYDFGPGAPGPLLKRTDYSYLHNNNSAYLNLNIVDRVSSITVYNGDGNQAAQTVNEFDNYSHANLPLVASNAIQHDASYGTSYTTRGNITAISRWRNTDGTYVTTTYQYDDAGNKLSAIDPDGYQTLWSYTDSWTNNGCLPTGQTKALMTRVTNALGQSTSTEYNACDGSSASVTDLNNNTTSYTYDLFGRMKHVALPDGGQKSLCYSDDPNGSCYSATVLSSYETNALTVSTSTLRTTLYDGLGRIIQTQLNSDPGGAVFVDRAYDSDGRLLKTSNPYRAGDTVYWTTNGYDGLGRLTSVANPDNSSTSTAYSGTTTTITDESGRQRKSQVNALGLLTIVWEDPAGANSETDYSYDVMGNLLTVNQHGSNANGETPRLRSFTYDSLSRLITSTNPETGTVCYGLWSGASCAGGYDANGNLVHKTDANGTVASYWYDALNRITNESYSDGITPSNIYNYDVAPGWMPDLQNTIGRLTNTGNQFAGGASGKATATTYSYDAMGRIVREFEQTPPISPGGFFVYSNYDLAGNLTDLTYPDGRHITQSIDGAGRLASVTDSGTGTTYLSGPNGNVQYWPNGEVSASVYGNGVVQNFTINSRLQPCHSLASLSINGSALSLLDRQSYYNQQTTSPCGNEAGNNGNVYAIVDNLQVGLTQAFGYDSLNRITSGSRSDGAYNHTYNYDSFGNLTVKDNLSSSSAVMYGIDPSTNRLLRSHDGGVTWGDYIYDATGTMTQSGDGISQPHTYQHNAMGQLLSIDSGAASYVYNESGQRAFKQTASGTTEYVYFNGQPVAERDQNGNWTDYIYANGQKIVKLDSVSPALHVHGDNCSTCNPSWVDTTFSSPIVGYQIQSGDRLVLLQRQVNITGGIQLNMSEGGSTWPNTVDQNGALANDESGVSDGLWHKRIIDLGSFVGQHVSNVRSTVTVNQPSNVIWDTYLRDVAIVSTDGSVHPVYTTGMQPSVSQNTPGTTANLSADTNSIANAVGDLLAAGHYYIEDHLGSTQMELSSGGWPIWSGQFTPFGQEILSGQVLSATLGNPQPGDGTNMHYKFTGKERDTESGLDYFGARYYGPSMGRFMSPDWDVKPVAVPYASFGDPQTLNLYAYVENAPLNKVDADGHWAASGSPVAGNLYKSDPECDDLLICGFDAINKQMQGASYSTTADEENAEAKYETQVQQGARQLAQQQNGSVGTAEKYLSKSKAMRPVLKAFKSGHFHLSLINDGNDRYDPATRTVYWDPNSALETTDGGHQTPALGLGHEMAHATGNRHMTDELSGMADPQYDTREERRVILNYEDPAARQLGESTRSNHGGTPYNVASPTSIVPLPQ